MLKILVTGGAGFIGSHTCVSLLQKGYEVVIIDSYINSKPLSVQNIKKIIQNTHPFNKDKLNVFSGDLRDEIFLEKVFLKERKNGIPISGVIHFAGLKAVGESVINPLMYWDNNLLSTINLLKCMENNGCRTIVFSSSATIYGHSSEEFIKENSKLNPINPYGNTKATIENLLNDLFKSKSELWRIANLRYFNPIGAHESGLIGENPLGTPNNIFPFILQVASCKEPFLKIFGKDWPTKDGTGVRDYIHVMDLAEGHLVALEYILKQKSQILNLNLGTGKGTSVLELIENFQIANNIKIPYKFVDRRYGDVPRVVADNSRSTALMNWEPKRNIQDMCRDGWKWKSLNPNGF